VRTPPLEPVPVGAGTGIGGVGGLRRKRLQLQSEERAARAGPCLMILPSFRNFS